jgi:hypothetical protein
MKARAAEYWVIGILSIGAIYFINQAQNVSSAALPGGLGPRTFPLLTFWAILLLNAWLVGSIIWNNLKAKKETLTKEKSQTKLIWRIIPYTSRQTLGIIFACLLLAFLWKYFGFFLVSFLFVAGASWFLTPVGRRSIVRPLALAGVFTLAIYSLFVYVFKIPLS